MNTNTRLTLLLLLSLATVSARAAQSAWVHYDSTHTLVYSNDNMGNHIPDFSYAGYEGGGVAIPTNVPVQTNLNAIAGDNTAQIQAAINYVSGLTPDANGFRGAVLLNPGTYQIAGNLTISSGGVTLRGSGNNTNTGTILLVTGAVRNVLTVSGSSSWSQQGGTYGIADSYVPLGATNFHVSSASSIVWGTNITISADANVFTNGTLLYAYDWAGTNQTVNGVAFVGTSSATADTNVSISGIGSNYHGYTSTSAPFSGLSAAYQSILVGGEYSSSGVTATVTLNNLTVGHVYAVQVWMNDPRGGGVDGRTETVTGTNVVTLAYNVPAATGGVGQYTIGVFTAKSTSQPFFLLSSSSTQLNALLVSDVTATGYQPVNPSTQPVPLNFSAGETIIVQRPWTQPWINAIGMSSYWSPGTGLQFERQVVAVSGNQVTIDVPLCNPIESQWTAGLVYQATDTGRIQQCGLENLCAISQGMYNATNILSGIFAQLDDMKNCWVRNVWLSGWGNGIGFGTGAKWCTLQDCQFQECPASDNDAAPAAWTISGAQCLVQRCVSSGPYYHIMVTQASTPGPNVFLNLTCSGTHYNGGPHADWAAGALHDCITMAADPDKTYTPYLAINNRGADGSGQGWGAGFSIMYNCQVPQFQLEQPGVTNHYNWTIGGIGSEASYSDEGIYDNLGSILNPVSLYLEQLKERLGPAAIQNIGYAVFNLSVAPASQSVVPGTGVSFTVNVAGTNNFSDTVALGISGLPVGASATFSPASVSGSGSATLTIVASNSIVVGNYPLTINGVDGNLTNTATLVTTVTSGSGTFTNKPGITHFSISNGNIVITGTNGQNGDAYYLLESTNVASPLSLWVTVATNVLGAAGNFTFTGTNVVTPGDRQQFYILSSTNSNH